MTYEKHGDILRVLDKHGWTRALVYWEKRLKYYLVVAPIIYGRAIGSVRLYPTKRAVRQCLRSIFEKHGIK